MDIQNKIQWANSFMQACEEGKIEDVRHLCQKQYLDCGLADIHWNEDYGFRLACSNGHLEVVKYLLTSTELIEVGHNFANLHAKNDEGFRWACFNENWDMVRWLVMDYGIKKNSKIEESLEKFPQAQEYFRVKEDLQGIQKALFVSNKKSKNQVNDKNERATKKAKKL